MTSMENNAKLAKHLFRKYGISVDENEDPRSMSNAQNARNVHNIIIARIKKYTIRQTMYNFFFWCQISSLLLFSRKHCYLSMLDSITKPIFVLPTITSVVTIVGILVVCLTAPKSRGMSLLFYILCIQYDKNPQLVQFCFTSIVSFG